MGCGCHNRALRLQARFGIPAWFQHLLVGLALAGCSILAAWKITG